MSRAVLAAFALCCSLGVQADQHQQDLAYSLGVRLGERLHEAGVDGELLDLLADHLGLTDTLFRQYAPHLLA